MGEGARGSQQTRAPHTAVTDGGANTTTYSRDTLNRVTLATFEDPPTVTYAYDCVGNRASPSDLTLTTTTT